MTIYVCGAPMTERKRWDEGVMWCFHCRKRVQFWQVLLVASKEAIEASMGFWTHTRRIECEHGHLNGDLFPGRWREWDDE